MGSHTSPPSAKPPRAAAADPATRAVLDAIRRIVRALRVSSRSSEKQVGLSGAQLFVLQRLADGGRALSVNELAARTLTDQSSVSVVVQKLVDRGLVAKARSATDARRTEMNLTPAGRRAVRRSSGAAQDRLIASLDHMATTDRRRLAQLLDRLVRDAGFAAETPGLFFEPDASASRRHAKKD